jgi:hypothetical protein
MKIRKKIDGMVIYNRLIRDNNFNNDRKYLNILVVPKFCRAVVAEWLTQSFDTRCPQGFLGSIPPSSFDFLSIFRSSKVKTFGYSVTYVFSKNEGMNL